MDPIEANPLATAEFGQRGVTVETGTTAVTGGFYAIQILETANFALLTEGQKTGDAMTGFDIDPTVIYGDFTAFTLTSGKVRAYSK
jgi:hypothetical protein